MKSKSKTVADILKDRGINLLDWAFESFEKGSEEQKKEIREHLARYFTKREIGLILQAGPEGAFNRAMLNMLK